MRYQNNQSSQASRLLKEIQRQGKTVFTHSEALEIAKSEGLQLNQLNVLLSRLIKAGALQSIRRGLYAFSGPWEIFVHPFLIATRLVEPSAISHWSALQHHGLTEQLPIVITASAPQKVYTPSMRIAGLKDKKHAWEIGGIRYEYIHVKSEAFFGIEQVWLDERSLISITDRERTLLDVFAFPHLFGGVGEALGILSEALPILDFDKLVSYAVRYDKKSVAKRLGWALEQFGVSKEKVEPLLLVKVSSYLPLDPQKVKKGTYNKRWMIQENIGEIQVL